MSKYERMSTTQKLQTIGLKEGSEDYEKAKKTLESGALKNGPYESSLTESKEAKKKVPLPSELITYKKGGKVSSASSRADGIAVKGKTRGRMV